MRRVLDLFNEQGTLDEMKLGSLRDALSDTLFPGTSYIHTRLRYVLTGPTRLRVSPATTTCNRTGSRPANTACSATFLNCRTRPTVRQGPRPKRSGSTSRSSPRWFRRMIPRKRFIARIRALGYSYKARQKRTYL